jgi:3-deoxy-D-manno-octulosonic-acid transferase
MSILYNIFIHLYTLAIRIGSLFSGKAQSWVEGRKDIFHRIGHELAKDPADQGLKTAWFHCASLGEFEQGRPVMEKFRDSFPEYRIILTFFSPSGYEIRKNWKGAGHIFYLPADTRGNAKKFLDTIRPDLVFFVKYEYWFNYMREIAARKIPHYVISAIFRPEQHFFRWYGSWFRKQLKQINWFFVQDPESETLLKSVGISSVSVTGDTRFDRVYAIAQEEMSFPFISDFCGSSPVIVAGSTWKEDEALLLPLINEEIPE